ncbi:MAG: DUF177 domain-containing protein [Chloroflexota bacterium]|nr:DUF177 domain-containing protein [Chloroflexota bacterium]
MKQHTNGYVGHRVLKLNVGFLLAAGPGHDHETTLNIPKVRVAEDVDLDYLTGTLRLTRTQEGVLVQGTLHAGYEVECLRCLDTVQHDEPFVVEELYAYPATATSEFSIEEDGILDIAPLVRAEVLIGNEHGVLCKEDCKGLCPECGVNLNHEPDHMHEEEIDPRFAALKALRDQLNAQG